MSAPLHHKTTLSDLAKARMQREFGEPWFLAGWKDVLMMHYAVQPEVLQPYVPFPLDVRDGLAYVSLVGFTLKGMRPAKGGWIGKLAMSPIATHEFLNVRTYVKCGAEVGIYFLAEWLPNLLSVMMGRPVFGLPYRWGKLSYAHDGCGELKGTVSDGLRATHVSWEGPVPPLAAGLRTAAGDTLTEWLMERYTAFTEWMGLKRRFRVWHPPWPQMPVNVRVRDEGLMGLLGDWFRSAKYVGAHWSPGFDDVWMGAPRMV